MFLAFLTISLSFVIWAFYLASTRTAPGESRYFIQWVNEDGVKQLPIEAEDCQGFNEAAAWAAERDLPPWATPDTLFYVYLGEPKRSNNYARFTVRRALGR